MTDDRTRGVHLSDKQLVFVVMAATVVAGVVFLFGVLVGRGVPAGRVGTADGTMMTGTQVVSDGGTDTAAPDVSSSTASTRPGPAGGGSAPPSTDPARAGGQPSDATAAPVPPAIGEQASAPIDPPTPAAEGATYTVQVAATKKRSEADGIIRYLKSKGFDAHIYVPEGGDKLGVLRIRIGAFATQKEAEAVARRVARDTRYKDPWVTH